MSEKEFDYGTVVYKHRFNMTRSLDDYKETILNKCIRIGLELKYKTMACDKLVYEMQIVYKDEKKKKKKRFAMSLFGFTRLDYCH